MTDVLTAAVEYGIEDLKKLCIDFFKSTLTVDTVCEALQAALSYNNADLKKTCLGFVERNTMVGFFQYFFRSVSWSSTYFDFKFLSWGYNWRSSNIVSPRECSSPVHLLRCQRNVCPMYSSLISWRLMRAKYWMQSRNGPLSTLYVLEKTLSLFFKFFSLEANKKCLPSLKMFKY